MESWRKEVDHSLSQERWRRVSGNAGLDARTLAIVRELFHWRDAEAKRRNQPARRVLRDDLIVEIARRGSADVKRIEAVRGMERGDLQRRMGELAAAMQRGWTCPRPNVPTRLARARARPLGAWANSFSPRWAASPRSPTCPEPGRHPQRHPRVDGLSRDESPAKHDNPPKLAHGWRADFIGRLFEDLLGGKLSIRVGDPESDHPLAFERQ